MVVIPGDTEAHFESKLRFLQEHPIDSVGAFAFSPE
jgi:tRNA A37 methylthiotransferase MiaB